MKNNNIEQYWSNYFGITTAIINTPGITVVPHQALKGFVGAWIFKREEHLLFSVPPALVGTIKQKLSTKPPELANVFSTEYLYYLFDSQIERIIGPVFQGYYDAHQMVGGVAKAVRPLNYERDQKQIDHLSKSGDGIGWDHSGIAPDNAALYGYELENQIVAIANYKMRATDVGFIGVYTHPQFRGKGFGQAVVKAAVMDLMDKGCLVRYQTLWSNAASIGVAWQLGIEAYGSNVAIRLLD